MTYRLEDVKVIRKRLGMTQAELAQRAGVSQSLIAKIESNRLDPTYSNAQKIFAALSSMEKRHELIASELMNPKIIGIKPLDTVKEAIQKMRGFEISQLPVIVDNKVVGLVSESTLLDAVTKKDIKFVKDIMAETPPIVSKKASINAISGLLKYYPIVLVSDEGKLVGLITKSDLLRKLYKG